MSRRVKLPGAEELFRPTRSGTDPVDERVRPASAQPAPEAPGEPAERQGSSGRVKHDEKMPVYISADELMELEHARLALRRELGGGVDRGRVVREAVAIALADLAERGPESDIVRRLSRS